MECRINAEHPEKFTPSAGKITAFNPPGGIGVRVDSAQYQEGVVSPYYDSLIAKLIVHGKDREEALARMNQRSGHVCRRGHPHLDSAAQADSGGSGLLRREFDTKFMERSSCRRRRTPNIEGPAYGRPFCDLRSQREFHADSTPLSHPRRGHPDRQFRSRDRAASYLLACSGLGRGRLHPDAVSRKAAECARGPWPRQGNCGACFQKSR